MVRYPAVMAGILARSASEGTVIHRELIVGPSLALQAVMTARP
jgi:hypothetical protein